MNTTISSFRGKYEYLSNFYKVKVEYKGLVYGSAEAAFQAQKCVSDSEREQFLNCTPNESKKLGRKVKLRSDWEKNKLSVMTDIVRAKFTQHKELADKLLSTANIELIEGNYWGDKYWGVDSKTGKGRNHLGIILMKIRDELRERG